jgi:hypothetical protein
MTNFRLLLIASILIVGLPVNAWSASPIGRTVDVNKNAFADAVGTRRALELGSPVVAEETINTDRLGKAAFRFVDDTELSVGPNSTVKLDRFIYDPDASVKSFVIRATKGMFRFVTGKLDHDSYVIRTPSAVIGVRGTQFDVLIEPSRVRVSVLDGQVILCPEAGRPSFQDCVEARAGQSILSSRTHADVRLTSELPPLRAATLLPLRDPASRVGPLPGDPRPVTQDVLPGADPGLVRPDGPGLGDLTSPPGLPRGLPSAPGGLGLPRIGR